MDIYLPIAEMAVDVFLVLGLGGVVGFLSGLFGIGGGFLTTPLLIFIGIPPAVAVATGANQIIAPSVSAVLAHWRRGNVDLKMGLALLAGGIVGSALGVGVFAVLHRLAQLDVVVKISYVLFLSGIGLLMLRESLQALLRRRTPSVKPRRRRTWIDALPLKMRFRRSRLYISVLLPLAVGLLVGVLAAIMGVGGGFIMVPAMIYLLGMPSSVVVGTSLFQIIFVTATVTVLQTVTTQTVDVVLAVLLIAGSVIGAQFGVRVGARLRGDQLRVLLAVLVLSVAGKLAFDLIATPPDSVFRERTAGGAMSLRRRLVVTCVFAIAMLAFPPARAELVAALSNHLVAISTGFSGTDVLLFGAIEGSGDVVVVVRGPESVATVHRKGRNLGIWVNEADLSFANVPGYWSISSSRPLQSLVPDAVADFHQLGLQYLRLMPLEKSSDRRIREFRAALIRNKLRAGLYTDTPGEITFLGNRLFRTDLWIPANAPIGIYTVSVYLIRDNDVVSAETTPLVVGKVGFEARVYDVAHRRPLGYGILAVLIAAMAGWTANLMFRKG